MSTAVSSLGQLAICVSNVKDALEFYQGILGLPFLFSPSEQLAFLQCGDTRIMLTTPQGSGEIGKNSVPYFKVENIEAFFHMALAMGAKCEREASLVAPMADHELWIGFLRDPDNNLVGIMEEKPLASLL